MKIEDRAVYPLHHFEKSKYPSQHFKNTKSAFKFFLQKQKWEYDSVTIRMTFTIADESDIIGDIRHIIAP